MLVKFQKQIVSNLSHYAIYILIFYAQIACIWKNN
jgi:hypothetical protein